MRELEVAEADDILGPDSDGGTESKEEDSHGGTV